MTSAILRGKPDVGNPHVRFDDGKVASYPPIVSRPEGVAMRDAKPRRGSQLYNKLLIGSLVAAALAGSAGAKPVVWYRFDGTSAKIKNWANPGTMDGTLKSITTWGSNDGFKDDATKFPTRVEAFPSGTTVADRLAETNYTETVTALSWTGEEDKTGVVYVPRSDCYKTMYNLKTFTAEAFVKIPAAAKSRSNAVFPIIEWGKDKTPSESLGFLWGFYYTDSKFKPFFRYQQRKSDGSSSRNWASSNPNVDVSTDTWHHFALSIASAGDGETATAKIYLDYSLVETWTISSFYGFYMDSNAYPFTVGANTYNTGRSFMGEIAELRLSDEALESANFLKPVPAGPVDADTLFYLPMGESTWFGSSANANNSYYGILNVVPNALCDPYWLFGATAPIAPLPSPSEDVLGASVRNGCFAPESFANTASMSFARVSAGSGYNSHVIVVPTKDDDGNSLISSGSFTLEFSFKTDGAVPSGNVENSYTFVNDNCLKIMINQANRKLKTRLSWVEGSSNDFDASELFDDGNWHHYALVYDKPTTSFTVWVDNRIVQFGSGKEIRMANPGTFTFGGVSRTSQGFVGQLDDFRVTRRALKAHEFLTTVSLDPDAPALDATFEDDYATGNAFAPEGVDGVVPGDGAVRPTFADRRGIIDLYNDGERLREGNRCLELHGGYVQFPCNSLLECNEFTAEFFAKFTSLNDGANLIRLSKGREVTGRPIWAVIFKRDDQGPRLMSYVNRVKNGTPGEVSAQLCVGEVADGRWHHWAVVCCKHPTTAGYYRLVLYKDYEQVGGNDVGGPYDIPCDGSTLTIGGTGTANAFINGYVDNLRIRRGACDADTFMRFKSTSGMTILFL